MNHPKPLNRCHPSPRPGIGWLVLVWAVQGALLATALSAADRGLADLSLEELMNVTVTSASKREEKLGDVATAITVLSNDDLIRSGATSLPDALRLVPGMSVGFSNAHDWSVAVRGFGGVYSNKLLVLVDGRAVYSPFFAGVYWNQQQLMLEDLDRIEIIRGPGATVWGANAVNGVINVVSRSARDTQGTLLYGEAGNPGLVRAGVRYGGRIGANTYFRVFGSYQEDGNRSLSAGGKLQDSWNGRRGGFRVDHHPDADTTLTWQMDATQANFDAGASQGYNFNTLGRWIRRGADQSGSELQAYFDHTLYYSATLLRAVADTFDVTAQHNFAPSPRQNITAGLGYRFIRINADQNSQIVTVRNPLADLHLFSAFAHDEFTLVPDKLTLTAGAKFEHNDFTGFEIQPSLRALWKPEPQQSVWAAVSRAVRTPSIFEGKDMFLIAYGQPFTGPDRGLYLPSLTGNAKPSSEILWAYELGYRHQLSPRVNLDLALFLNDYHRLIYYGDISRLIPGSPLGIAEIPIINLLRGRSYGGEAQISFAPTDSWRLIGGYSIISMQLYGPPGTARDASLFPPRHQLSLRSAYDFSRRASFDAQLRFVDRIPSVPAYFTADLRLNWRCTDRLELSLMGQNLLDPQHLEQAELSGFNAASEVPRSVRAKLTWRF